MEDDEAGDDGLLDVIEHRRSRLWLVTFVVMGGLAGVVLLAPATADGSTSAASWPVRGGLVLLVTAFGAYVVEQERSLRVVVRRLVEVRRQAAHLREQVGHDPLTGLLNQATFHHRVDAALSRSKRHLEVIGLLLLDIDHFRALNQRHGSAACDRALVEVAQRLRSVVRAEDAVARLRSDEFAILLEHAGGADDARRVAQRAADALDAPFDEVPGLAAVHVSIGVVVHAGGDKEQTTDLLRDAELARRLARARPARGIEVFDRVSDG